MSKYLKLVLLIAYSVSTYAQTDLGLIIKNKSSNESLQAICLENNEIKCSLYDIRYTNEAGTELYLAQRYNDRIITREDIIHGKENLGNRDLYYAKVKNKDYFDFTRMLYSTGEDSGWGFAFFGIPSLGTVYVLAPVGETLAAPFRMIVDSFKMIKIKKNLKKLKNVYVDFFSLKTEHQELTLKKSDFEIMKQHFTHYLKNRE